MNPRGNNKPIQDYWDSRAQLGKLAGSDDIIAKQLEIEAIAKYVKDGQNILEIGCGNGLTAIELARRYYVRIIGLDYVESMISAANEMAMNENLKGEIHFETGDVLHLPNYVNKFDLIFTERVLINLTDFSLQKQAIIRITELLKLNGVYIMCENSQDGLDAINRLRLKIGLSRIDPPWHNVYFRDADLNQLFIPGVRLENIEYYSSTYYLLSRVINAWCAMQEGREPSYNDSINHLAIPLPSIGELGQGRIWLWRKIA